MLIPTVEDGIESMLRATLPMPAEIGDVSFEAPSGSWSAQLSRVAVNLFLAGVGRSPLPTTGMATRTGDAGQVQRREGSAIVGLTYLVSAWAGTPRDEHRLLGDVLDRFLRHQELPPEHLPSPLESRVRITLSPEEGARTRDLWSALRTDLRASFVIVVSVASDAYPWVDAATGVADIEPRLERTTAPRGGTGGR